MDPVPGLDREAFEAWMIAEWNALEGLPRFAGPPKERHRVLFERAIHMRGRDRAWVRDYFRRVSESPWCRGEIDHPGALSDGWDLEYALEREERVQKAMRGEYDHRPRRERKATRRAPERLTVADQLAREAEELEERERREGIRREVLALEAGQWREG